MFEILELTLERVGVSVPWRRSLPAKVVAVGFTLFIVAGNVWMALALTGSPIRTWVGVSFAAALAVVALGGLALGARQLVYFFAVNIKSSDINKYNSKNV